MTTVNELFQVVGATYEGVFPWEKEISIGKPGLYIVALSYDPDSDEALSECPLNMRAIKDLLRIRPECKVDKLPPDPPIVASRLSALWLPDEVALYIGKADKSLRKRVGDFYKTEIGARGPHAGGWPLKMLSNLNQLWVHAATIVSPRTAEVAMLDCFTKSVSPSTRALLQDPLLPLPFANLERTKTQRKKHGISGATEPRRRRQLSIE